MCSDARLLVQSELLCVLERTLPRAAWPLQILIQDTGNAVCACTSAKHPGFVRKKHERRAGKAIKDNRTLEIMYIDECVCGYIFPI